VAEVRYRVPKMHLGQRIVYEHPARFKRLAAGRRWRKTTLAMRAALRGASGGDPILWGAPTYQQCRIGWEELYRAAGGIADFHKSEMEVIVPPGNGRISFVSLDDPDNARGKTAYGAVIDEAGFCAERAWYDVIRPMLSDCNGWALIMGTPKGHNWFWREWQAGRDDPDGKSWQAPTLGVRMTDAGLVRAPHPLENPQFPFEEAERLYKTLPRRVFEQEFLAEFIADAGGVFRKVMEAATAAEQPPQVGHQYIMGVDWGKSNDFTVLSVLDITAHQMVAMDRFNQIDWALQRGRLRALYDRYRPTAVVAEANSIGDPNIEALQYEGMPVQAFTTTNATKAQIIEGLSLAFEREELAILNDPVLVAELQAYELERLPSGLMRYNAPEGLHDDCVISLALAWYGCGSTGPLLLWGADET